MRQQTVEERILDLEKIMYKNGLSKGTAQGSMLVKCLVDASLLESKGISMTSSNSKSYIVWCAAIGSLHGEKINGYGLTIESAVKAAEREIQKILIEGVRNATTL